MKLFTLSLLNFTDNCYMYAIILTIFVVFYSSLFCTVLHVILIESVMSYMYKVDSCVVDIIGRAGQHSTASYCY